MVNTKKLVALRRKTLASFSDCKKALEESGNNLKKAEIILRKKGFSIQNKENRQTNNGIIEAYIHNNRKIGVLLELNSETDFVARNKLFKEFAHQLAMQIASMAPKNEKELKAQNWIFDENYTVEEKLQELIHKTGESIRIKRFVRFELSK